MTFYDVGANVGFHSVIAARLIGPARGTVVCFEPLEENAAQIEHNRKLNGFDRLIVRREALGNTDGKGRFLLSTRPTWGVLASAGREPSNYAGHDMQVRVRRLDSVVREDHLPVPDVMKIDVEGAEAAVLEGGLHTLRVHRPVLLIELHGTNTMVAELLRAANYQGSVLGTTASISDSPWNAYVFAIPVERTEFRGMLDELCRIGSDQR
jgi:FkbM family methyltransferase